MNWSSDAAAALLAPDWRVLPSPFNRNMMREIAAAITSQSFTANTLFNAYFYRAAVHILQRYGKPPFLVLENRIDAARRALAAAEQPDASDVTFMARALIALVRAAPVVEAGVIDPKSVLAKTKDPNVSIAAVAAVALLFGDQGKPTDEIDEDAFFAIVGALIAPAPGDDRAAHRPRRRPQARSRARQHQGAVLAATESPRFIPHALVIQTRSSSQGLALGSTSFSHRDGCKLLDPRPAPRMTIGKRDPTRSASGAAYFRIHTMQRRRVAPVHDIIAALFEMVNAAPNAARGMEGGILLHCIADPTQTELKPRANSA